MIYSKEFRREVLAACDASGGTRGVVTRFDVSKSWVRRIKQERRELGKTAPKTTRDWRSSWANWSDWLCVSVADQPDIYQHELQSRLEGEHGVKLSKQDDWGLVMLARGELARLRCQSDSRGRPILVGPRSQSDITVTSPRASGDRDRRAETSLFNERRQEPCHCCGTFRMST